MVISTLYERGQSSIMTLHWTVVREVWLPLTFQPSLVL